jgi:lipoyl(octanoyl) transferase
MSALEIRRLQGLRPYAPAFAAMRAFTDGRGPDTRDEIWVLEHEPVYTLGLGSRMEHVLDPGAIPVVRADRGGQVTYHGPGQLVVYTLLDLKRRGIAVRALVARLEQSVIDTLAQFSVVAHRVPGAPGVYVGGRKLAALGLRVRKGCCYHGVAVNVSMDLAPFAGINPCGYAGLEVTRLADLGVALDCDAFASCLLPVLCGMLDGKASGARSEPALRGARPVPAGALHG